MQPHAQPLLIHRRDWRTDIWEPRAYRGRIGRKCEFPEEVGVLPPGIRRLRRGDDLRQPQSSEPRIMSSFQ